MNTSSPANVSERPSVARAVLSQRKAPAPQLPQRQPFRVLQTSRSPAQLSLFFRPGL